MIFGKQLQAMEASASAPVEYQQVTQSELEEMLARPFNPPAFSATFTKDEFSAEYWNVHRELMSALSILGDHDDYGNADFCMNDDCGFSRFIGIELTSKRLWRPELISLVRSVLKRQPEPYCIYLDHGLLDEPDFFILVFSTKVAGCIPTLQQQRTFDLWTYS